jgi:hypothetical protein
MYQYGETVIISTKEVAPEPHRRPHDAAKKAVAQRPVETPCPLTPPISTWQSLFFPADERGVDAARLADEAKHVSPPGLCGNRFEGEK